MSFKAQNQKIPTFRVLDKDGNVVTKGYDDMIPRETLVKIFEAMVTMNEADHVFNAAQRQSRISFYMQQLGEEATNVGSSAALEF
jgi:2-oxoisovalerate dehydrogenase E1 component alpha subunit